MLSSITPLGQRGRGMSWTRTVIAFWIGAILAGAFTFGVAGLIGEVLGVDGYAWLAVSAVVVALLLDLAGVKPFGPRRQVDEDWLGRYRDWVTGFGFGAQLGSGFATIVVTWMTWALLLVSVSLGIPDALYVGAALGVGRSLLLLTTRYVRSPSALTQSMQRFSSLEGSAVKVALVGYVLLVGVLGINAV